MSIEKLNLLGIFDKEQLKEQNLEYWWQRKINQIKFSEISKELKNERLILVNNLYDELKESDLKTLKNYFPKVKKKKNKAKSNVDKILEVDKNIQEIKKEYLKKSSNKIFKKVRSLVCRNLSVMVEDVKYDSDFLSDLGADSLDIVEIIMDFEEAFNIEIPDDDAELITTVGDAVEYILEKQQENRKGWKWSNASDLDKFAMGLLALKSIKGEN